MQSVLERTQGLQKEMLSTHLSLTGFAIWPPSPSPLLQEGSNSNLSFLSQSAAVRCPSPVHAQGMQQGRLHTNAWNHCLLSLLNFLTIAWYGLNLNAFSQAHIWTTGLTLWHYLYHSFWQDDELKQPEHSTTMNSSGFNTPSTPPKKKTLPSRLNINSTEWIFVKPWMLH